MKLRELISFIEKQAPPSLQEDYDNAGLICGSPEQEISGVLVSLDCIEITIEEAVAKQCNVVVCHHPIIFRGLKRITGRNYIERTIILAIKHDIAIYAAHTNLDHVQQGVNAEIMRRIGVTNPGILAPKNGLLRKLAVYVPHNQSDTVRNAMFNAGAGHVGNYADCSFNLKGEGTFKAEPGANPALGEIGKRHTEPETKIEMIYPVWQEKEILNAMKAAHPYEEVAYDILLLGNELQTVGAGMVGDLEEPLPELEFLNVLKQKMKTGMIRYTALRNKKIARVAVCGGSGSFLLKDAIASGADVFITGDFKYHEFFDAENRIVIADIGHYESEQFTIELLGNWIKKNFNTFAIRFTEKSTNPINYL